MKTAALFKNGRSQAVRLPKDFEFEGISEVEIAKEGDTVILRPLRKSWSSFAEEASFAEEDNADADFLKKRNDVVEEGRVKF